MSAIFHNQNVEPVEALFRLIMDVTWSRRSTDFIEHLALQAPNILGKIKSQVVLSCGAHSWVSYSDSSDILFELYIPSDAKSNTSLSDLLEYNSLCLSDRVLW